eukprot:1472455-Pyramimonas_sp.AAC.4
MSPLRSPINTYAKNCQLLMVSTGPYRTSLGGRQSANMLSSMYYDIVVAREYGAPPHVEQMQIAMPAT